MKLIEIDKSRYRQHLSRVIIGFIATLLALSLLFGTALIEVFGNDKADNVPGQEVVEQNVAEQEVSEQKVPEQKVPSAAVNPGLETNDGLSPVLGVEEDATSASSGNFRYNLLGVILALLTCAAALHQLKTSRYFTEIYYVWQLKQLQNLIYRRLKKIKQAADDGDADALILLSFYYASQKQVYLLDDNTLTLGKLERDIEVLEKLAADKGLTVSPEQFSADLIKKF